MSTTLRADLVSKVRDTKYSFKATWRFGDFAGFEKRPQTLHKKDEERFTSAFLSIAAQASVPAATTGSSTSRRGVPSITIAQFTDDVLPSVGLGKVNKELLDEVLSSLQLNKSTHQSTKSKYGEESKHGEVGVDEQQQYSKDVNDTINAHIEVELEATESKEDLAAGAEPNDNNNNNNIESKLSFGDKPRKCETPRAKQEEHDLGISLQEFARLIESLYTPAYIFGDVLSRACARGDEQVIQGLLERGCDPNETDGRGMTCFHYAAEHGSTNAIECLAQHCPAELQLDTQDENGWTAALFAAARGHVSVIETLHKMGANLALASVESRTVMHWASLNAHTEMLTWLLKPKRQTEEETNAADRSGWTALHCAVVNGDVETVRVLIQGGIDPNIQDKLSRTAQQYCDEEMRPLYDAQFKKLKGKGTR